MKRKKIYRFILDKNIKFMQLDIEIITNFRNFIQNNDNIQKSQNILKQYRNIQIKPYNLKESRCIWMSLLLYKFKKDTDVSEELWAQSRQMIISILRSDDHLKDVIEKYLKIFELWKNEDLEDLVTQIGSSYYNLLQIKQSIENTKNTETINHWLPHYQKLILKIRNYCLNIGILEKIDNFIVSFETEKYNIIKEIMNKVYWDKIEEEIKNNNLEMVYMNLTELKMIILDIVPKNNNDYINEYIDVEYIKTLVGNNVFDKEHLLNLFNFVINLLKKWDGEAFKSKYDGELNEIKNLDCDNVKMTRYVLEKMLILSSDLKNRKALWNIILKK